MNAWDRPQLHATGANTAPALRPLPCKAATLAQHINLLAARACRGGRRLSGSANASINSRPRSKASLAGSQYNQEVYIQQSDVLTKFKRYRSGFKTMGAQHFCKGLQEASPPLRQSTQRRQRLWSKHGTSDSDQASCTKCQALRERSILQPLQYSRRQLCWWWKSSGLAATGSAPLSCWMAAQNLHSKRHSDPPAVEPLH